jgi:serine protease
MGRVIARSPAAVTREASGCYTVAMVSLPTLALALASTTSLVHADDGAVDSDHNVVTVTAIRDGGLWREVHRTRRAAPGGRAGVVYVDPATGRSAPATIDDTAIVQLEPGVTVDDVATQQGLTIRRPLMPSIGLWLIAGAAGEDGVDVAARLIDADGVHEAFPNLALRHRIADVAPPFVPDDPRYPSQFFLDELRMEDAWAFSVGSADVRIAVVDNGCDLVHLDLADKFDPGHDVITDDEDPSYTPGAQGNEHGTACAGLVGALTNNNLDVAGACPLCRLSCTRLLPAASEPVPLDADVRAFEHALQDDVDVVSNSWGFIDAIPVPRVLAEAIVNVQQNGRGGRGAVVVFASGNDSREIGDDELLAVPGVLGVGATNNLGELTQFSNRGRSVDVVAPTGTVTTDITGRDGGADGDVTFQFGGTSSACPLVAGIAGLMLSAAPELTADDVTALLERTAEPSPFARPDADGHDLEYGFGLVRADLALAAVIGDDGTEPPSSTSEPAAGCWGGGTATAWAVMLGWGSLRPLRRRRRR